MREALQVLLQLSKEGLLQRFAIGGAIAASFYLEAIATLDAVQSTPRIYNSSSVISD